ncbi:MAG: redox-sensing transcriptional repressor Rex [Lachnospiraceae bacterium]|nr:redox-sensing transcriptional repressor Rex [Lachnospiraceae bacterium]
MNNGEISTAVIKRLPRYYRYLGELLNNGVVRISSKELSERMGVTASQIRQDLNNFGGFGQQGYGYNVDYLHGEIGKILGLDEKKSMIIVGAGHLGQAFAKYSDFVKRGFVIKALFDIDKDLIGRTFNGIKVLSMDDLKDFLQGTQVDIAAITVPKDPAPKVANELVKLGIKAIWNFAPTDLSLPKEVALENVHLTESLMRLSYKLKAKESEGL